MRILIFTLVILVNTNLVFTMQKTLKSKSEKVDMIELFTSQGCSSCPVADKWLAKLKNRDGLFRDFIPMEFHVTYWNYIGWKDIFSKKEYDRRQRLYSRIWAKGNVYTPQFVVNGKEYRKWFSFKSFPKFSNKEVGILQSVIKDAKIDIVFSPSIKLDENLYINVAILGMGYRIPVKTGENGGRMLQHDFVVLSYTSQELKIINPKNIMATLVIPPYKKDNHTKAIVIWVSDNSQQPIQAVADYL